jgi:hypothetical protein
MNLVKYEKLLGILFRMGGRMDNHCSKRISYGRRSFLLKLR